jgi:hypothetical protein
LGQRVQEDDRGGRTVVLWTLTIDSYRVVEINQLLYIQMKYYRKIREYFFERL